ncbi:uncharacterized protein LOC127009520 isoform X2 [Eriocheir sinensis]|uniref:uncharacterized protein LOC127009520 isoform X2 n=1 Tax=Eriocheir sinensis TaxID=95602 RepID=UPI0021C587E7|nr:uncharacterized protein LOC127009520 isoform X2 [Eriocheir sinensis]
MLRLVLLTTAFTLIAAAASLDCVDKEVPFNSSEEIKKFTVKEGQLLFYPYQGFDGVTINFVVHDQISHTISSENLCINGSRWYRLKVTVTWGAGWNQYCKFQVDTCSGSCGTVKDLSYNNFKSFSVIARGASFWSVNNTHQQNQCNSPVPTSLIPSDAPDGSTPPALYSQESGEVLMPWLVGVGSVIVVVAAVVVAVLYCARKTTRLRLGMQQSHADGLSNGCPSPEAEGEVYVITNSLYEPLGAITDTGLGMQQSHADGLSNGCPSPEAEGEVYVITNSLYEPLGAITDTASGHRSGGEAEAG